MSRLNQKYESQKLNFNFVGDLLIRTKNTKSQNKLKKSARFKNTKGAFKVNDIYQKKIRDKNILLIDDIVTTEATINNCCLSLLKYTVGKIYVCSIAKTY